MKYAFILEHRNLFSISAMCKILGVKANNYYYYKKNGVISESKKQQEDTALCDVIKKEFINARSHSGARRLKAKLLQGGLVVSRKRITKLMKKSGLKVKTKRKFRLQAPDANHAQTAAENLLNREFKAIKPNQKFVGDITYIPTTIGFLYLAVVIDLFSRKVVGWSLKSNMKTLLVNDALIAAIKSRAPRPGLLWHTDRGSQYSSKEHRELLARYGVIQSMSRKGNCWDNAVSESFFATLKTEYRTNPSLPTPEEVRKQIFEYIEVFYNRQRLHSALGNMSPAEYEKRYFEKGNLSKNETEVKLCA